MSGRQRASTVFSYSDDVVTNTARTRISRSASITPERKKMLTQRPNKRIGMLRRCSSTLTFQGVVPIACTLLFKIDYLKSPVSCIELVGNNRMWMGTEEGSILIWDKVGLN